jgi:hypothetical protein
VQKFFASFFQERRIFFSEEKKQKTFVCLRGWPSAPWVAATPPDA